MNIKIKAPIKLVPIVPSMPPQDIPRSPNTKEPIIPPIVPMIMFLITPPLEFIIKLASPPAMAPIKRLIIIVSKDIFLSSYVNQYIIFCFICD